MVVVNGFKQILSQSVFRKIPKGAQMDTILATLFHRSAATLYFIYALWATFALVFSVIPVTQGLGAFSGQLVFPLLVFATSAPACFGATFWPNMARLELFSGSGFVMGILIYLFFVFQETVLRAGNWAGFIVLLSILVIPAARTAIVIVFLLRQAEARNLQEE